MNIPSLSNTRNNAVRLLTCLMVAVSMLGCSSLNNTEKGAIAGAGAGAVAGGAIGYAVGSAAKGAIAGAVVGGAAGAIIGHQMDKQQKELEARLPGAHVTRVGEGLVVTFDSGLLFAFDQSELSGNARENLSNLASSVKSFDDTDLLIIGHTDNVGSESYNDQLSVKRAQAAAEQLYVDGVTPSRVTTMGKGESDPIASNETDAGRTQNRRVEVVIYASEEYRKALEKQQSDT